MSSTILLAVLFFHGVWGTFPPVNNPPPIPSQSVRNLDIPPPVSQFFVQEDLPQAPPQPLGKDEGQFSPESKPDEQRWYLQENQPAETAEIPSSAEVFDRYYQNGEPAIGPVATPLPDDAYIAQPSSISNVNPNDPTNSGPSDIWIVTRGSDNQFISERWLPIQVPSQQVVEVINQDPNSPEATDLVKSISAPVPFPPDSPAKTRVVSAPPENIVQQIWVRVPSAVGSQKVISDPTTIVQNVQSVKQVVDTPAPIVTQAVQQVSKDAIPFPPPPVAPIASKKTFTVPPPPPPPIKGTDKTATVISAAPAPATNTLVTGKSGPMQQVRHIWIPTSTRTGKFITVPVSNVNSDQSVVSTGLPLNPAPISVSSTWVLKQNGPFPSFQQQKSIASPPVVQSGKVIVQNPPVVQTDSLSNPQILTQTKVPPLTPVTGKTSGAPVDIWPVRKDVTTAKVLTTSPVIPAPDISLPPPKSGTAVATKSFPIPSPVAAPIALPKFYVVNSKLDPPPPVAPVVSPKSAAVNSKLVPPPPAPMVSVSKGKPCPFPVPKAPISPPNQNIFTVPRVIIRQPQPLTRIIRVNRYPTGSYYLLNSGVRPNFYTYPTQSIIQQPKSGLVRVIQAKQLPFPVQSKQPFLPPQVKQISVPVQSKSIPSPVLLRKIPFLVPAGNAILPLTSPKAQARILYPSVQAIRYAYPLSGVLKASPVPGKRVLSPLISTLKLASPGENSASSSSESSSENDSSESSEEDKKTDKSEKPEPAKSEGKSKEPEKESESKSDEREKEGEETSEESQSKESIEAAESQILPKTVQDGPYLTTDDGLKVESIPYIFEYDLRDRNGTMQRRQEISDVEGRVSGSYGYQDPDGIYRIANHVADRGDFRVNLESNEPGTVTHESAYSNFISNKVTDNEKFQTEVSAGAVTNNEQRD